MSPRQIEAKLEWAEVNSNYAADTRLMMQAERFSLQSALRSGDAAKIAAARDEALRVAKMWGVEI